ncbi:hypothetical protein LINGRAHAP2_LOCUS11000 [Linum grandiflorum]
MLTTASPPPSWPPTHPRRPHQSTPPTLRSCRLSNVAYLEIWYNNDTNGTLKLNYSGSEILRLYPPSSSSFLAYRSHPG